MSSWQVVKYDLKKKERNKIRKNKILRFETIMSCIC